MMLLDVVIDPVTLQGEKWFLGRIYEYPERGFYFGVTAANFAGWFVVGAASQWLFQRCLAIVPWCRGPLRPAHPRLAWGIYGVFAGVLGFNLAVTIWIGDLRLAAASAAVTAVTLAAVALGLRSGGAGRARRRVRRDARGGCRLPARHRRRGGERARGAPHRRRAGARRGRAPGPARARDEARARRVVGVRGRALPRSRGGRDRHRARGAPARRRSTPRRSRSRRGSCGSRPAHARWRSSRRSAVVRGEAPRAPGARRRRHGVRRARAGVRRAGVPFTVLRVVTDTPAAPLPPVARIIAAALSTRGLDRSAAVARAVVAAVRSPIRTATFVRASLGWCHRLRGAWREAGASVAAGSAERAGERQRSAN